MDKKYVLTVVEEKVVNGTKNTKENIYLFKNKYDIYTLLCGLDYKSYDESLVKDFKFKLLDYVQENDTYGCTTFAYDIYTYNNSLNINIKEYSEEEIINIDFLDNVLKIK